ncbi:MAG: DNA polymerase I [Deltaproteobacteria bacterium]|nr:DNA polymerase I [Deltaproteobacteria bacterium]
MTEEMKRPKIALVDGNNYLFRAFYAIRDLSNSKGFPTNAIYGFTNMLVKLLREQEPDCIAVAFDAKGPTFRHDAYDGYKATRKATPDALVPQIPFIKQIVRGFAIPVLEKQGIEADDIIGTIARRQAAAGMEVVVVSGDKDMMQLVTPSVRMVDTMKEKTYDIEAVKERFGVAPEKVVEILGLMGDASDNIPGVPGIGPKGAQRLIEQFGSIDAILAHPEQIHNAKVREAILRYADQARMSRELACIRTDAEFDFDLDACRRREPDRKLLMSLFQEFEFSSLLREFKEGGQDAAGNYRIVGTPEEAETLAERLRGTESFSVEPIASGPEAMRASLVGIAIGVGPGEAFYIPLAEAAAGTQGGAARLLKTIGPILGDPALPKLGHDLKSALIILAQSGIPLRGLGCDTMISSYLLNPARRGYDLAEMVLDHLGRQIPGEKEVVGSGAKRTSFADLSLEKTTDYACRRAEAVLELSAELDRKIAAAEMVELCRDVETPLISVLAVMEMHGVLLDVPLLKGMSAEIEQLLALSEEKIHRLAGEEFNINSPKQLQAVLFEKLGLPRGRKTKDGYSTDVDVLTALAVNHELPAEILAYRGLSKLKSTYIDALPELVHPRTGRVHTTYNQTVTATGRLSSSNPNLQNIPVRTLEGKRIRQAFIAAPGCEILSADYSQIELRVLAHLSGDEALKEAFASGADIHSRTASDVFGVFPEMVSPDMRRQAKVINFGVLYGMSAFGLAKELGVAQKLAQAYIDSYFQRYSGVRRYLDGILAQARTDGYVTTLFRRRRYLPEIHSPQPAVRQFAERMAINAPIQGTAADLIKVAMVRISRRLAEEGRSAAMIMQVHDELVFEAPVSEREPLKTLVREEMEGVLELSVPLRVEISVGRNWDEAHT